MILNNKSNIILIENRAEKDLFKLFNDRIKIYKEADFIINTDNCVIALYAVTQLLKK